MAFEGNIVDIFFEITWTSIACTFSRFRLAYVYIETFWYAIEDIL